MELTKPDQTAIKRLEETIKIQQDNTTSQRAALDNGQKLIAIHEQTTTGQAIKLKDIEVGLKAEKEAVACLEMQVRELKETIETKDATVEEYCAKLGSRAKIIEELESTAKERDEHMQRLQSTIETHEKTIAHHEEAIKQQDLDLEDRADLLDIQEEKTENAEARIAELNLAQKAQELNHKVDIKARDHRIKVLEEAAACHQKTVLSRDNFIAQQKKIIASHEDTIERQKHERGGYRSDRPDYSYDNVRPRGQEY